MKLFTTLYDTCIRWAKHRYAERYLIGLSSAESTFFPIPPDVMLAPMCLAQPLKAWRFASLCTLASVVGGVIGYALGWLAFDSLLQPLISDWGYQAQFDQASQWFIEYGAWIVFLAGFSPIPYKVFTISAGVMHMAFLPFVIASAIGRGLRFFLVAALMKFGGPMMESKLKQYIEIIGWCMVLAAVALYLFLR